MTIDVTKEISRKRIEAKEELARAGLKLPRKPPFELPRLPKFITELNDDDLMTLFVSLVRWQDYAASRVADVEISISSLDTQLEVSKAKHMVAAWTDSSSERVTIARAKAVLDPDVLALEDSLAPAKLNKKLLGVMVETLSRDAAVVSRELSRRIARTDQESGADRNS